MADKLTTAKGRLQGGMQGSEALSGIESRVIEGLADFLVTRTKEEAILYLQEQFTNRFCKKPDLRTILPRTCETLETLDATVSIAAVGTALNGAARRDLEALPDGVLKLASKHDRAHYYVYEPSRLVYALIEQAKSPAPNRSTRNPTSALRSSSRPAPTSPARRRLLLRALAAHHHHNRHRGRRHLPGRLRRSLRNLPRDGPDPTSVLSGAYAQYEMNKRCNPTRIAALFSGGAGNRTRRRERAIGLIHAALVIFQPIRVSLDPPRSAWFRLLGRLRGTTAAHEAYARSRPPRLCFPRLLLCWPELGLDLLDGGQDTF
jgi:hypothetical protein